MKEKIETMQEENTFFSLPRLPYPVDGLTPYINQETMEVHHFVLHKRYVDNLNAIIAKAPRYQNYNLVELIQGAGTMPPEIRLPIFRNAGGVLNHNYYFDMMHPAPNPLPKGNFADAINATFGSFENFQKEFKEAAMAVFGSGWIWLVTDEQGNLHIMNTQNLVTPYSSDRIPVIPIDMWEHAYFAQYLAARADYIDAWFHVADWEKAAMMYDTRALG